jgi:hypothetical protein
VGASPPGQGDRTDVVVHGQDIEYFWRLRPEKTAQCVARGAAAHDQRGNRAIMPDLYRVPAWLRRRYSIAFFSVPRCG